MKTFQTVILFATLAAMAQGSMLSNRTELDTHKEGVWKTWIKEHNKIYSSTDLYEKRRQIFMDNYEYILEHNLQATLGMHTFTLGLNKLADIKNNEIVKKMHIDIVKGDTNKTVYLPDTSVESIDWREYGAVTPVKDQGQCGSCWSFSTTGSIEGAWANAGNKLVSLSEQQLVDCSSSYGNMGCNGGLMDYGFEYVIDTGGLETEYDYPYDAKAGTCDASTGQVFAATITDYADVPQNSEQQLKNAVAVVPVSVAIEADQMAFQFYKNGVFTAKCGTRLDHGVLTVGYGTDSTGQDYWIVKNSWGETWGDQGYIYMARNVDNAAGQCGIASQPSYAIV